MRPRHWVYVLVHAVILLAGALLAAVRPSWMGASLAEGIGASLVATGVAGWMIFLYLFVASRSGERVAGIIASGVRAVFPLRAAAIRGEYEKRLQKANERVDVIGFGLRGFLEDQSPQFEKWTANGVKVRILLIDPDSPTPEHSYATARDREEGKTPGTINEEVRTFIRSTATLLKSRRGFQVRLYRAIPAINYFRVDDEVFWGPYLLNRSSRNTPTVLVGKSGEIFQPLIDHFDDLWSDDHSRSVPDEWLS